MLLVRLCSLLPYDLMSYALGLTKVSFGRYLLGTWLGRLPEIVLWAYIGSTAKTLADVFSGRVQPGIGGRILLGLGIGGHDCGNAACGTDRQEGATRFRASVLGFGTRVLARVIHGRCVSSQIASH